MTINYYSAVPASQTAFFTGINQTDSLNDFAFQPAGIFNDLCVTITPLGWFRSGFNTSYKINYQNVGTTVLTPGVVFFSDNDLSFVSSNPAPNNVFADSVLWNLPSIGPFQSGSIIITMHVNPGTPFGTIINSAVRIDPVINDANTSCNYANSQSYCVGSYDPNNILVDQDTILETTSPFLEYTINFQNTGNDTAFNVRVLNNISAELDINSFELVTSSYTTNLSYDPTTRLMTFDFNNINLTDSATNELMSHGFIRYRIQPLQTLTTGDIIKNTAFIFFDFNSPVQTDTAVTIIISSTGMEHLSNQNYILNVFPNPSANTLTAYCNTLSSTVVSIRIYNLYGQTILTKQLKTSGSELETKFDVSLFSKGIYFIEFYDEKNSFRAKFAKE